MNPFGRQKSLSWPKRWAGLRSVFIIMMGAFATGALFQYLAKWTSLQRYYLPAYVQTWTAPYKQASEYLGFFLVKGSLARFATDADIELTTKQADGTWLAVIAGTRKAEGWKKWDLLPAYTDQIKSGDQLHQLLARRIYHVQTAWELARFPGYCALGLGMLWLILVLPRDRKLALEYKYGRRLSGPQLVNASQYDKLMGRPDGFGFLNLHRSLTERIFFARSSRCVYAPSSAIDRHILLLGDSGVGKSSAIRQILIQIRERGESAIVYDPAREYISHFFDPKSDFVLNPLDARFPGWLPCDEIDHQAEADMLAESIFPIPDETPMDKRFFFTAARDVLIELLKHKPTPSQLYAWMRDEQEMIRLLRGTPVISQVAEKAHNQRSGVFGTLTQSAKIFEFLPDDMGRPPWSARKWAEERKGWIFLTSLPMLRPRLRPVITLWIELLLMRVMNDEEDRPRTHFILDELATLPRIEGLVSGLFESRKARAPIVIGLQGKAQQDAKYGQIAQAMVSMAATKVFMGTSEPDAAKWISEAIGKVKIERYRESRTESAGSGTQASSSSQCEMPSETLIMESQIMGLPPLHAYFRHGNFVVPIQMPYIRAERCHPRFVRRQLPANPPPAQLEPPSEKDSDTTHSETNTPDPVPVQDKDKDQEQTQGYF